MSIDLTDDDVFKRLAVANLSNELTHIIDHAITSKKLTFTQKKVVENFRDRGLIDAIIVGDFKAVTIDDVIELLCVFKIGLSVREVTKSELSHISKIITKH